jgi:hypothetical protein
MTVVITEPPENLVFASLAKLYEQFHALLIGKEFQCPRKIPIVITAHHFFHLVKLQKGLQTEFDIEIEEPLIIGITDGFGEYAIDKSRAERLSWIPEILGEPHEIWEPPSKKTADEMVIREYDKSGSAFRAVLLKREPDYLKLITCMPMRRRAVEALRQEGQKLWPKK